MSMDRFPVGLEMDVSYPEFQASLTLLSTSKLKFEIKAGPLARIEVVDIHIMPLGNSLFAVTWQEKDGATVANIQDFGRRLVHSFATLADGRLLRMTGHFEITRPSDVVFNDPPRRSKALAGH